MYAADILGLPFFWPTPQALAPRGPPTSDGRSTDEKPLPPPPPLPHLMPSLSLPLTCDTWFTSARVRSFPPVMLNTMPVAELMFFSIRGVDVAARAATSARFFPLALPAPSMAVPLLLITARTSAKSTFTKPGTCGGEEVGGAAGEADEER